MSVRLSILIPYYRDNPTALLRSLDSQAINPLTVEILVMDDGSGQPDLRKTVGRVAKSMRLPTRSLASDTNQGRSATRNALQDAAKADWVLFLDADMRIDDADFLNRYLDVIARDDADIVFGGFEVEDRAENADTDLHRVLSYSSDCLSASERQAAGAQYVASSNLCVRKSVLEAEPFDGRFTGWGWEDSEWAARVGARYRLLHIDNPAVHLGLETTETLLSRFATSGPNYRRFLDAHPAMVRGLPLYRIVSRLRRLPGQRLVRGPARTIVRMRAMPVRLRVLALKLWRASHYADAVK